MNWHHQQEIVIGKWTSLQETAQGLQVTGQLNLRTPEGQNALEHVTAGDSTGLNIGYSTPEGGVQYDGTGVFTLSEIDLIEISVVASPADRNARITGVKMIGSKAELVDELRHAGLARAAAVAAAGGGWPALAGANDEHEHSDRLAGFIRTAACNLKGF